MEPFSQAVACKTVESHPAESNPVKSNPVESKTVDAVKCFDFTHLLFRSYDEGQQLERVLDVDAAFMAFYAKFALPRAFTGYKYLSALGEDFRRKYETFCELKTKAWVGYCQLSTSIPDYATFRAQRREYYRALHRGTTLAIMMFEGVRTIMEREYDTFVSIQGAILEEAAYLWADFLKMLRYTSVYEPDFALI